MFVSKNNLAYSFLCLCFFCAVVFLSCFTDIWNSTLKLNLTRAQQQDGWLNVVYRNLCVLLATSTLANISLSSPITINNQQHPTPPPQHPHTLLCQLHSTRFNSVLHFVFVLLFCLFALQEAHSESARAASFWRLARFFVSDSTMNSLPSPL